MTKKGAGATSMGWSEDESVLEVRYEWEEVADVDIDSGLLVVFGGSLLVAAYVAVAGSRAVPKKARGGGGGSSGGGRSSDSVAVGSRGSRYD